MPIVSPTVSTVLVPFLSVTCIVDFDAGSTITYNQIVNSLGAYNYKANFFYVYSSNCAQVGQVFTYNATTVQGNQTVNALPFVIDPYQTQCAAYFYPQTEDVIFDGNSTLSFNVNPSSTMYFKMFTSIAYVSGPLDGKNGDNQNAFKKLEESGSVYEGYFDDYCNYIIDKK